MRAKEFIFESLGSGAISSSKSHVLNNLRTYPNQSMYSGSGYYHSLFVKALAGAGAGDTPDAWMGVENWAGGDPVFVPYSDLEIEMLDRAAKYVGDDGKRVWGGRSEEPKGTNTTSPVSNWMNQK
jgi:hypothetical protein